MKAFLTNYRQSPRKVRLIADAIKGKPVNEAEAILTFMVKRGANPMKKILTSAVSNAKANFGVEKDLLFVKNATVDKGVVMKRVERRARGSANIIQKRSSHIEITLDTLKDVKVKRASKKSK